MGKKFKHFRTCVQAGWTFLSNCYMVGFAEGKIYTGPLKNICFPGLNCYSCPGAVGACPIGSLQAVMGSWKFSVSLYVGGFLMLVGALLGRFVCGWLCPSGTLLGGIPLVFKNPGLQSMIGFLFRWKVAILLITLLAAIIIYRPFCKYICPLGATYALFNRISLYRIKVDADKCTHCGVCSKVCKMGVDPTKTPNNGECIRCGDCVHSCPQQAIQIGFRSKIQKQSFAKSK